MSANPGHPVVAALLDLAMRPLEPLRDRVIPLASGRVLEVGAGTGLNFERYDPASVHEVIAVEPDPAMRRRAEPRAASAKVPIQVVDGDACALGLPDDHVDCVVLTFTLCTVADPEAAARELRRVLRPGGRLLFAEHTLADGWIAGPQRWLTPAWRRLAGGCHLDRDAVRILREAGFELEIHGHGRGPFNLAPVHRGIGT